MKFEPIQKQQTRSGINFLLCFGGIVAFILLVVFPNHMMLVRLDERIEAISARIDEQEILHPFFKKLLKNVRRKQKFEWPFPGKDARSINEHADIISVIREMAISKNLILDEIKQDLPSLILGSRYQMLDMSLKGRLADIRRFLIEIISLPQTRQTERIEIRTVQNSRDRRLNLKIWFVQKKK
jgi:hypothetical protein